MKQKLAKCLAQAGIASRRKAEELIRQGLVSLDGRIVREVATRADPDRQVIAVRGRRLTFPTHQTTLLLHKPRNYVTSRGDPEGRPTVYDLLEERHARLFHVGRLDFVSEGLLLFTDDGELAQRLAHPRFEVAKIYQVKLQGMADPSRLDRLKKGVSSEGEVLRANGLRVVKRNPANFWLEISLAEGKKHAVRRMCQAIGYTVLRLKRTAFGPFRLAGLAAGRWRMAERSELEAARKIGNGGNGGTRP